MRAFLLLALALLVAGCVTPSAPRPSAWLVGLWLGEDEGVEFPLACASGLPIRYTASGGYETFEERGRWRLDGDRLTETATAANETADEGTIDLGRPYQSSIAREGDDAFVKTFADGARMRFRRCPE